MAEAGHNSKGAPIELTADEAAFVATVLERDIAQGLAILEAVQKGTLSDRAAVRTVDYLERAKPIWKKLKGD